MTHTFEAGKDAIIKQVTEAIQNKLGKKKSVLKQLKKEI